MFKLGIGGVAFLAGVAWGHSTAERHFVRKLQKIEARQKQEQQKLAARQQREQKVAALRARAGEHVETIKKKLLPWRKAA